ncbi:MAG: undecaprenyldiphospho-muramoylpentapeptide beta-N-acetylglucosaminyltransferase [Candidatus Marinimicrobia bacterium]|nr:undecaprenyldiphospho-muramoylpentapeptide beta-N-acetylglucosaminyltransferase [Candidatus Neomarinimicrobiota bacterium]
MGIINESKFIMENMNILIAGGGTGGHLFPALAIGEEILSRNSNIKIHYVGSAFGLESKVFPIKDVWHTLLPIRGIQRDLSLKSLLRNSLLPFRILRSFHKTNNLINDFSPDIIIGTGGYASALPLLVASTNKKNIPIILQEQNSFPGITTKWFAKRAKKVCVAFKDKKSKMLGNIVHTGNPIRKGLTKGNKSLAYKNFNFNNMYKTIFLFGGSQGSSYLNNILSQAIKEFKNASIQVIWQTGDTEFGKYKKHTSKKIHVTPFINNMSEAYAISDLIICRSGALTISEITVCGKPSILIPFAHAAGDHQTKNAQVLVDSNAAKLILEKNLNKKNFLYTVMNLIHNEKALNEMRTASKAMGKPNATSKIVDHVLDQKL